MIGLLQEISKNNNKRDFQTYYLSLHIKEPEKDVQTHHKVSKMKEIIKIRAEKNKRKDNTKINETKNWILSKKS